MKIPFHLYPRWMKRGDIFRSQALRAEVSAVLASAAAANESEPELAETLRKRAERDETVAAALWKLAEAEGLSRPGCFVKQNGLPTDPGDC